MTRHIRLPIDASEPDTGSADRPRCMGCPHSKAGPTPECALLRVPLRVDPFWSALRAAECLAAEAADKARERDAALGVAVRDAVRVFAHPAYGEIDTLEMMATILRKKQHGFDSTPALLDAVATHLRTEET